MSAVARAERRTVLHAVVLSSLLAVLAACGAVGDNVRVDPGPGVRRATGPSALGPAVVAGDPGGSRESEPGASVPGTGGARARWHVDPATSGQPFPGARVEGLLTFRGSPTRSFYGAGPLPASPVVRWTFPAEGGLCSTSDDGEGPAVWCGTGWTGQPAIWRTNDGGWLTAFGAYDGAVHLLDAETGAAVGGPFQTGDLIKGSVSVDPEGYPLLYVGSRDNYLRILAVDRDQPTELWRFAAGDVTPTLWNDDWDGSPLVLGDLMLEGGENSQFHVFKLNRHFDVNGKVTVAPRLLFNAPGWDSELLAEFGSDNVSIESSVAVAGHVAYFANSGGLVQGWDLDAIVNGARGVQARTFRFWMGDDTDATVVVDADGALYVTAEYERATVRSDEVGQLVKLDPSRPDQPLVWSVPLRGDGDIRPAGAWATPALYRDVVIVATNGGEVIAFDRMTGQQRWQLQLVGPTWSSPVVVEDTLIQGDCAGVLRGFDLRDSTATPTALWSVVLGGCIESTPAVYGGMIIVGTRAGQVFGLGEATG